MPALTLHESFQVPIENGWNLNIQAQAMPLSPCRALTCRPARGVITIQTVETVQLPTNTIYMLTCPQSDSTCSHQHSTMVFGFQITLLVQQEVKSPAR